MPTVTIGVAALVSGADRLKVSVLEERCWLVKVPLGFSRQREAERQRRQILERLLQAHVALALGVTTGYEVVGDEILLERPSNRRVRLA